MSIKETLARNYVLKNEAAQIFNDSKATGMTAGQKARYDQIKTELAQTSDYVNTYAYNQSETFAGRRPDKTLQETAEYEEGFKSYLRSRGHIVSQVLAANVGTSDFNNDGVLLPSTFEQSVVERANGDNVMRKLATVVVTTQDIPFPVETAVGDAGATAEAPSNGTDNLYHVDDPTFSISVLKAFKVTKAIPISEELLQDYMTFSVYAGANLARAIAKDEEAWFVNGNGSTEPEGIVTSAETGVTLASTSDIDVIADIADLIGSVPTEYLPNAGFLMSRATKTYLRKQTNPSTGLPLWATADQQLQGYPVYLSDQMPAIEDGSKPILFGDFKQAMVIGDRGAFSVRLLDQPRATEGIVTFIGKRRVDSRVLRTDAVKALVMSSGS